MSGPMDVRPDSDDDRTGWRAAACPPRVFGHRPVGGVELAVVVPSAFELPHLVVG